MNWSDEWKKSPGEWADECVQLPTLAAIERAEGIIRVLSFPVRPVADGSGGIILRAHGSLSYEIDDKGKLHPAKG